MRRGWRGWGLLLAACAETAGTDDGDGPLSIDVAGRYVHGTQFDVGAAQAATYDGGQLFVVDGEARSIDILDLADPGQLARVAQIAAPSNVDRFTGIAARDGVLAVAARVEAEAGGGLEADGQVLFYDAQGLTPRAAVTVGPGPEGVAFSLDGRQLLVANEAEPNHDVSLNPEGSVAVVDLTVGLDNLTDADVTLAGFTAFNLGGTMEAEFPAEVRTVFDGFGFTRAQELEPEVVVPVSDSIALAVLQEHNAWALVNLNIRTIDAIVDLGAKSHAVGRQGIDPSDVDGVNLRTVPVSGLYQPGAMVGFVADDGETYLATANEGEPVDRRPPTGGGYAETAAVADLVLDPTAFPTADRLQTDDQLGRLEVTRTQGDDDGDGDYDRLFSFGGRSFSIWTPSGQLVFDSGDDFERLTIRELSDDFNADVDRNGGDVRSPFRGPEPSGIAVGRVGDRQYAFIGLERVGGFMVYDVTEPARSEFVTYVNDRDFDASDEELRRLGAQDLGPEALVFVPALDAPQGEALLAVTYSVSGTTVVYRLTRG
jgi:hypothetical protein